MQLAKEEDLKTIMKLFQKHKDIFPHIRQDYIKREILKGNVIFHDGIVITFGIYKRKQHLGDVTASAGDVHIGQIVSSGVPLRASLALHEFFRFVKRNVYLTVRENNVRACKFYEKNDMKRVGTTSWMGGKLPGLVYKKEYVNDVLWKLDSD